MSAETELARFDTRTRRAAPTDERIEQTDFRTIGAREQGQLALDEAAIEIGAVEHADRASSTHVPTEKPTRADLEAALGCARATIGGLREQVEHLEAERDRLRQETEPETEGER